VLARERTVAVEANPRAIRAATAQEALERADVAVGDEGLAVRGDAEVQGTPVEPVDLLGGVADAVDHDRGRWRVMDDAPVLDGVRLGTGVRRGDRAEDGGGRERGQERAT
jgi:hypothetical protein